MVDKLNWDQNKISWYFGHEIVKRINNIILASVKKDRMIIYIEAGLTLSPNKCIAFYITEICFLCMIKYQELLNGMLMGH